MILLEDGIGNSVTLNGISYSFFAGNDYLGLSNHPDVIQAAIQALESNGVNFSASRHTTGSSKIHIELESLLANFIGQDDAVVFATGYMGNRLMLNALKGKYSIIFADSQGHPSI